MDRTETAARTLIIYDFKVLLAAMPLPPAGCGLYYLMEGAMSAKARQFADKVVLVTGAGRGIGKRLAMGFAAEGAKVGLLSRSRAELDLTRLEIEDTGGAALPLRADVTHYSQFESAVEKLEKEFGVLDILVCAAGVQGPVGPLPETDSKAWIKAVEINVGGVYTACRAVLPGMVKRRRGKIIVLGGGGTMKARPNFSAYASSKAAVVRLVETIAEEVHDHNVQINVFGPGPTYTHMTDEVLSAGDKAGWRDSEDARETRLTGGTPPEKQIELALFLASERSNHISGKLIHIRDNWKRLEHSNIHPELYTLRRVRKV